MEPVHVDGKHAGDGPDTTRPNLLRRISIAVDAALDSFFKSLARFTARRPWLVIFLTLALTLACCIGFLRFEIETDGDRLFTPTDAEAFKDRNYVEPLYGQEEDQVKIIGQAVGSPASGVLDKSALLELLRAWEQIQQINFTRDGRSYTYASYCAKVSANSTTCKVNSILSAWNFDRPTLEADPDVLATINSGAATNYFNETLTLTYALGGVVRDAGGQVVSAQATQLLAYIINKPAKKGEEDKVGWQLQKEMKKVVVDSFRSDTIRLYWDSPEALDDAFGGALGSDIQLFTIGYILVILWTGAALWRNSWAYQKVHLALPSLVAVGMGIASSFGLTSAFGVKFNNVVQILPLLLVGLGVDDTFVIIGCYFHEDPNLSIPEKLAAAMGHAGPSITVTSLTNVVAFATGVSSNIIALRDFCAFATVGILFLYIYQVTFFVAWLALDSRREARARHPGGGIGLACCSWPSEADVEGGEPTEVVHVARSGSTNPDKTAPSTTTPVCCSCSSAPFDPKAPTIATRIVSQWIPAFTLHPAGKIFVLLLEAGLIAGAIYGCTQVYTDFRFREWFIPQDSYLQDTFKLESKYFLGEQVPFAIYTKEAPAGQTYFDYQDQLEAIGIKARSNNYVAPIPPVSSWYDSYVKWLNTSSPYTPYLTPQGLAPNSTAFSWWLREYLATRGRGYANSVKFAADDFTVISSQISGFSKDIANGEYAIKFVDATRAIAAEAAPGLQAVAYGPTFAPYDGYRTIAWQTLRNVIIAAAVVWGICLLLLADLLASCYVFVMIVLCDVMLFGYMGLKGLTFNSTTSILLVLAVGLSVDYSAHIMRSFMVATGNRQERSVESLTSIGGEVLHGAFTTWLAIIPLAAAGQYIFQVYFQLFFTLIVVAIWHGIIILPIVNSYIGPPSYHAA